MGKMILILIVLIPICGFILNYLARKNVNGDQVTVKNSIYISAISLFASWLINLLCAGWILIGLKNWESAWLPLTILLVFTLVITFTITSKIIWRTTFIRAFKPAIILAIILGILFSIIANMNP